MGEVPGMDNYGGNLTDEAFDNPAMELLKDGKVNTAYCFFRSKSFYGYDLSISSFG
jgi:hypothetical protein